MLVGDGRDCLAQKKKWVLSSTQVYHRTCISVSAEDRIQVLKSRLVTITASGSFSKKVLCLYQLGGNNSAAHQIVDIGYKFLI